MHAVLRSLRPPRWARTLMSRASGLASLRLALDGVLRDLAGVFAGVKKLKPNRLILALPLLGPCASGHPRDRLQYEPAGVSCST